jgi:hypothetical protein
MMNCNENRSKKTLSITAYKKMSKSQSIGKIVEKGNLASSSTM